jgi:signal transduction histidine kinase
MSVVSDEESVGFEVRDSGVGMSEAELERVFEAFQQSDVSTTRKFGVTGLGLSIVRSLMRAHGGDIELLESNEGAKFRLRFPA